MAIREHFQKLVNESKRNILCNSGCKGESVEDLDKKGEDDIGKSNETHVNNGIIENDETCKQDEIGKTLIKLVHIWKLLKLMKLAIWI